MKKVASRFISFYLLFLLLNFSYGQNVAPILTATGNQVYCGGTSIKIVANMNINDPDDSGIDAIYIQISSGYVNGQDSLTLTGFHPTINSSWNSLSGKLTLTGFAIQPTYSELISAIEDVEFFNNSLNPSGNRTFSISVGQANYLPSNGHYYLYISNIGVTWLTAKTLAETSTYYGLQGYLATITGADEAQLAGEQASGAGWIGGSDQETEGVWKWLTGPENGTVFWNGGINGSSSNFAFWNTGEPNSFGDEDYTHITAPGVGIPGSWNDISNVGEPSGNYQPKGFIVEYGGTIGDPVLQISTSTSIIIPAITNSVGATSCGDAILNLQATSNTGIVTWYDTPTGGFPIATGNSFTTPLVTSTTTYYATADINCSNREGVTATIKPKPIVIVTSPTYVCNGFPSTITAQTTSGVIYWYDSFTSTNSIFSGSNFNVPNTTQDTVYYVEANDNNCLSERVALQIIVNPSPINTDENIIICKGDNLILDAQNPNSSYLWTTGETSQTINYAGLANYSVEITNSYNCSKTKNFTITEYTRPQITEINVNQLMATIEITGVGVFEYSIDGVNFQSSNVFNLPQGGIYTCYVRESTKDCGLDFRKFAAISYSQYFTPNNDGVNDNWTIKGMSYFPTAQVKIFDRFGKFIMQVDAINQNWNGTYNGKNLPATDYWFVAKISEDFPEQKGHFSLKR